DGLPLEPFPGTDLSQVPEGGLGTGLPLAPVLPFPGGLGTDVPNKARSLDPVTPFDGTGALDEPLTPFPTASLTPTDTRLADSVPAMPAIPMMPFMPMSPSGGGVPGEASGPDAAGLLGGDQAAWLDGVASELVGSDSGVP